MINILALNQCDQLAQGACQTELRNTKEATCVCIDEARDDLKKRIAGIADAIRAAVDGSSRSGLIEGSDSKVGACVNNIKRQL